MFRSEGTILRYTVAYRNYTSIRGAEIRILLGTIHTEGTAVAQWLRCSATNRKVAGSIPAGVIGILH